MQNQEEPEDISTKDYAKGSAALVALCFWATLIAIGVFVWYEQKTKAIILVLALGFFLPMIVWSTIGKICEKHSGEPLDDDGLAIPGQWGIIFIAVFFATVFAIEATPHVIQFVINLF